MGGHRTAELSELASPRRATVLRVHLTHVLLFIGINVVGLPNFLSSCTCFYLTICTLNRATKYFRLRWSRTQILAGRQSNTKLR